MDVDGEVMSILTGCRLKAQFVISGKRLLIFELSKQSNDTSSFCAPEAMCWLE